MLSRMDYFTVFIEIQGQNGETIGNKGKFTKPVTLPCSPV